MSKPKCPECKGTGEIKHYNFQTGENVKMTCYNCGGTGKMPEGYFLEDSEDQPKTFDFDLIFTIIGAVIFGAIVYWFCKFIWV